MTNKSGANVKVMPLGDKGEDEEGKDSKVGEKSRVSFKRGASKRHDISSCIVPSSP